MANKQQLKETNDMRRLMGLELIAENEEAVTQIENAQKMAEARALKEKEMREGHYIDEENDETDTGVENPEGEESREGEVNEYAPKKGSGVVMGAEGGFEDSVMDKTNIEKGEVYSEDSEGEETYNYGDDEGHDREEEHHLEDEEEMAPADRIKAIEGHLEALKKDMGYDEDHEDRDEEGTHFAEGKKYSKILKTLKESEIKTLKRFVR